METQNNAPTFTVGEGFITTDFGKDTNSVGYEVALQQSGKILLTGEVGNISTDPFSNNNYSKFALAQYNPDGSLDNLFGVGGKVITDFGGQLGASARSESIAIQTDNKIILAGTNQPGFALARYNIDGTLDFNFGNAGLVTTKFSSSSQYTYADGHSVTIQKDGKIIVVGNISYFDSLGFDLGLARYNVDGSLDTNFGSNGKVVTNLGGSGQGDEAHFVTTQSDGKILVAGGRGYDFALVRYNTDGSLDLSFDSDGIVTTHLSNSAWSPGNGMALQTDGKIVLAGITLNNDNWDFVLLRYNSNGSIDNSFGSNGKVISDFRNNNDSFSSESGYSVKIQSDGKILVAGDLYSSGFRQDYILARYNIDGSLDTSFGFGGKITTDFNSKSDYARSMIIQPDGKIVLAGYSTNKDGTGAVFSLARYTINGNLDLSFNPVDTLADSSVITDLNTPVLIAKNINVIDTELYTQGNYNNAHLTLQRHGVANTNDVFSTIAPISFSNGLFSYSGTLVGTVTQIKGKLDLIFNSNATQSVVTSTLRSLTYENIGNGGSEKINLDWTFSDGNTGSQGDGGAGVVTGTSVVNITDLTSPSVINYSPTANATNVSLNSDIVLKFNESIVRGTGNIVLKNSIGTVIATYNVADSQNLSFTDNILTINPSSDFAFSTRYFIEITNGNVKDLSGNSYLGTSTYEFTTTAPNNPPTGSMMITGNPIQGKTLTTSGSINDADGMGILTGQWFRDGFAITGATDVSYTLTQADVGKSIRATAYYTDGLGKLESVSSNTVEIANVNDSPAGSVSITGIATQNQTLTANNTLADLDGLGIISYQWLSNNKEISNATQSTYKLAQSDVGNVISVKASYTDGFGSKESVTSSSTTKIGNVNDTPTGNVSISGLAAQGQTLTTVNTLADLDGLGTIKYQWLSNGAVISGATKPSYILVASDAGKTISVKASYTDLLGTIESVTSLPTDAVISTKPSKGNDVLTGTAKNDTLSALAGNDILTGGLGADKLTGGLGADIFKYMSIDDSGTTTKTRDTITDFKHSEGDKIDLSTIDADSILPLDQVFKYIGTNPFSADATAQLRLDPKTGILYGSTNADNTPEFSILLSGVKSLVPEDFIL